MSIIFSLWTVIVFILFIAIVIWAYSSKRKEGFDEAARLPLEDLDIERDSSEDITEKHDG